MAEAIAVFGVAGNVLQFLDFGSKLVTRFRHYYRSGRDGSDSVPNVQLLTSDLQDILDDLEVEEHDSNTARKPFRGLARECSVVAKDLLHILKDLRRKHANESKAAALKTAFRSLWREKEITRLQHQLDKFRNHLILQLITQSREEIRNSSVQQAQLLRDISKKVDRLSLASSSVSDKKDNDNLGSRIIDVVVSKLESSNRSKQKVSLERDLIERLLNDDSQDADAHFDPPILSSGRHQKLSKCVLSLLRYTQMVDREDSIADAHAKTFKWIFDADSQQVRRWSRFPTWLSSDEKLYWVTGKAGSGKSTLMKYVCDTPLTEESNKEELSSSTRCDRYLAVWAPPPLRLITAKFFFWSSGAEIQMSQDGLLRSLLWQILSQAPSLTPALLPREWDAMCLYGLDSVRDRDWSEAGLMDLLRAAVSNLEADMRLCLFIDGLDEFNGDHMLLINLLKDLTQSHKVKVCVSSRPWDIFERTFEQVPSLRMEDLTHDDIKAYTTERLHSNAIFGHLRSSELQFANTLIVNIVEKAAGVFLWVKLVVSSLLSGMFDGDRVVDLQQRLDELPPDLEDLYDKMLDSINPRNMSHTVELFTIIATSFQPVNIILLSFIDDENVKSALKRPVACLSEQDAKARFDGMRRRLNTRTMGLLELGRSHLEPEERSELTVQYLHKTVFDFLQSHAVKDRLEGALKPAFDVHMRMCVGVLSYLKTRALSTANRDRDTVFWLSVAQFMYSASQIKLQSREDGVRLMDEFDKTASKQTGRDLWVQGYPAFKHSPPCHHFLSLAIRFGIDYYVEARAPKLCVISYVESSRSSATSRPEQEQTQSQLRVYPLLADAVYVPLSPREKKAWKAWKLEPPRAATLKSIVKLGGQFRASSGSKPFSYDLAFRVADNLLSSTPLSYRYANEGLLAKDLLVLHKIVSTLIKYHEDIWPTEMFRTWDRTVKFSYLCDILDHLEDFGVKGFLTYDVKSIFQRLVLSPHYLRKSHLALLIAIRGVLTDATRTGSEYVYLSSFLEEIYAKEVVTRPKAQIVEVT